MRESFKYQLFGLNILSDFSLSGIPEAAFSHFDVRIEEGRVPSTLEGYKDKGAFYYASPGIFLFVMDKVGRFLARNGKSIIVQQSENANDKDVNLFLLGSVMGAILLQRGSTALHGCAIMKNGAAAILAGVSGTGKSSLAAEFMSRGYSLIADDISVIHSQNRQVIIKKGIQKLKLWEDVMRSLDLKTNSPDRVRPGIDKYSISFTDQSDLQNPVLKTIIFLEVKNTQGFTLTEMSGIDKFDIIRTNIYRKIYIEPLGVQEEIFRNISAILDPLRVIRVGRPMAPLQIRELADFIESHSIFSQQAFPG